MPSTILMAAGLFLFIAGFLIAGSLGFKKWAEDDSKVSGLLIGQYFYAAIIRYRWPLVLLLTGIILLLLGSRLQEGAANFQPAPATEESTGTNT